MNYSCGGLVQENPFSEVCLWIATRHILEISGFVI